MLLCPQRPSHIFRAGHDAAALVVETDQRQMDAHLCPERGRHIGCNVHALPPMIGEAENGGHHVPTGGRFQRWSNLLLIADVPGRGTGSGTKAGCKQQTARIPSAASVRAGQGGGLALRGEDAGLLGVPGSEAVLRNEGLLLHSRLGAQRAGHIVEIPYLVPLVGGEGDGFRGRSRQWNQPRLCHQRRFQLGRQLLPTFPRPAQDTQAGGFAQIVFAGRSVLQNLR